MGAGERVTLEAFLAGLADGQAANARAAAARIDEIARIGDAMEGIERRTIPWAILAGLTFIGGLWLFMHPGLVNRWLVTACLAALPGVAIAYAWRVRDRSRADAETETLNRAHFLPHGGIYFPPGDGPACVVRVDYTPPPPELPLSQAPRDPRKKPLGAGRIW